ncbi:unnamed protein product [Alopecurus aequalis]
MANVGFILFTVLAIVSAIISVTATVSASPVLPARRSRFVLIADRTLHPPLPSYDCSKKSAEAEACFVPGSAGRTCCGGQCVDTVASVQHCGGCNKACKHGRTCCDGHCVDLQSDKRNCGSCSNQCNKKCNYGFCDYTQ